MDICDGYRGYIKIGSDGYIIQPLNTEFIRQNTLDGTPHTLEKLSGLLHEIQLNQDYVKPLEKERVKRSDWNGYYLGDIWSTRYSNSEYKNRPGKTPPSEVECIGPYCQYHKVKKDEPKWLETVVAVDNSVIGFHGKNTVKRYILTLLNIVSAIYGDPTLGADLKFVILRLIFYEGSSSFNPIDENDSKQSLENVNK